MARHAGTVTARISVDIGAWTQAMAEIAERFNRMAASARIGAHALGANLAVRLGGKPRGRMLVVTMSDGATRAVWKP